VKSVANGLVVAQRLAEFIKFLVDVNGIRSVSEVHLIGYSVGAHIAGVAASYIQKQSAVKIGRITGLDPAGPIYTSKPVEERLNSQHADIVDVYHTNSGKLGIAAVLLPYKLS